MITILLSLKPLTDVLQVEMRQNAGIITEWNNMLMVNVNVDLMDHQDTASTEEQMKSLSIITESSPFGLKMSKIAIL